MASQKGLGKGLGALLGDFTEEPLEKSAYQQLPIYKVEPNPEQPRQDFDEEELQALADSITVHGIIQPLTVREMPNGYYQIIAGERRWRAARMANLSDVPAVIIEADDKKAMELALIENLQRQDLNPLEVPSCRGKCSAAAGAVSRGAGARPQGRAVRRSRPGYPAAEI